MDHKVQKRNLSRQGNTRSHNNPFSARVAASVEFTIQSREHGVRVIIPRHDALAQ